jgi:hypothetical protein
MTNLTDLTQEDKDLKMMPIFQGSPHLTQREQAGQLTLQLEGFSTRSRWSASTP